MSEIQTTPQPSPPSADMIAARERAMLFAAENIPSGPMRAMLVPQFRDALLQQAGMLLDSYMVPDHFWPKIDDAKVRREIARANVVAALFIAAELGESAFAVMPQIYFIGGRPAWKTEFLRARLQRIYGITLRYTVAGRGDDLAVTASAVPPTGGDMVSVTVTMRDAIADGWTKNPKYKSLPARMLEERAGSRWISLYAPTLKGGMPDATEAHDADTAPDYSAMARMVTAPPAVPEPRQIVAPPPVEEADAEEELDRMTARDKLAALAEEAGQTLAAYLGARGWTRPIDALAEADAEALLNRGAR